jgi:hypothetical protein
MTPEQQKNHIQAAADYIQRLAQEGKIKSAQPLGTKGMIVQNINGTIKDGPFVESKEVIGGFFHIVAKDLNEAHEIAKINPFLKEPGVRIEIREIMHLDGIN